MDRTKFNPGEDDKLSMLSHRIEDGCYKDDQITAVQTLDSIISNNPDTITAKDFSDYLLNQQNHIEKTYVSEIEYVGKLQRRISRLQKFINFVNSSFDKGGDDIDRK